MNMFLCYLAIAAYAAWYWVVFPRLPSRCAPHISNRDLLEAQAALFLMSVEAGVSVYKANREAELLEAEIPDSIIRLTEEYRNSHFAGHRRTLISTARKKGFWG